MCRVILKIAECPVELSLLTTSRASWLIGSSCGRVILNLIMNAIEAMVSVSGRARVLRVRSENHGDNGVRVAVEDFGSGIPQEDMDRIFETFFTTKSEGMGMGLSICRSIAASHGGRITVVKGVPHGSVFQLILPGDRT